MLFKPPQNIALRDKKIPSVFLAGSIEMGTAEKWQDSVASKLLSVGYTVFNPRRDDWDSSWVQTHENPQFYQQVIWELNALEEADLILMYLDPKTKSPISLLELGLHAKSGKLHVVCPKGFWKKGNVDIVCSVYGVALYDSIKSFLTSIK